MNHIINVFLKKHLVKDSKANGDKLGLGNRNRLTLTLFIQHFIKCQKFMKPKLHVTGVTEWNK